MGYNSFGLEAYAERFIQIQSESDVEKVLQETATPRILGGGSNILFTQEIVEGLLMHNALKGIELIDEDSKSVWVKVAGGEIWHDLVRWCIERGYGGIENLSLIPGTVGAAPIQNIGAYGVELKDVFYTLEAVELVSGRILAFDKTACCFGYRDSVFKNEWKGRLLIRSLTLQLSKQPVFNSSYGAIKEILGEQPITLRSLSDAVINIRSSKLPDPKKIGNAGSFFKNPIIPTAQFEILQAQYPNLPSYPVEGQSDMIKVPAGWLIEQAGWKGKQIGEVGVHARQALVLVNYGKGKGAEIWKLATEIQADILNKFGIALSTEVNIW